MSIGLIDVFTVLVFLLAVAIVIANISYEWNILGVIGIQIAVIIWLVSTTVVDTQVADIGMPGSLIGSYFLITLIVFALVIGTAVYLLRQLSTTFDTTEEAAIRSDLADDE
ncbi:hypothetical protein K0C01_11815 [Salinarchaeum sp. IM2453]|uniref:hypothetical protein n=1 Tax=Salinarchaeum sp. IM2453 TaxID=2862870 RepID=UPI001C83EC1A|nr:hypothetical protein [Salinarchaeum sp. IM2453]QZA88452.1 hypothetical protein K0C01_11815 [Salinarchaeum sp. IM2453]